MNKTSRNDAGNRLPEALYWVQGAGWPRGQEATWMTPGPSCFGSPCQVVWEWPRGQRRGTDLDCPCLGTALRVWPPPRSSPPRTWAAAGLWLVGQGGVIRGWLWEVLWSFVHQQWCRLLFTDVQLKHVYSGSLVSTGSYWWCNSREV